MLGIMTTLALNNAKAAKQKVYVKETLTHALKEFEAAKRGEIKMTTEKEFLEELKAEGL